MIQSTRANDHQSSSDKQLTICSMSVTRNDSP